MSPWPETRFIHSLAFSSIAARFHILSGPLTPGQGVCLCLSTFAAERGARMSRGPGSGAAETHASPHGTQCSDDFKPDCNAKLWPLARISWGRKPKPREANR